MSRNCCVLHEDPSRSQPPLATPKRVLKTGISVNGEVRSGLSVWGVRVSNRAALGGAKRRYAGGEKPTTGHAGARAREGAALSEQRPDELFDKVTKLDIAQKAAQSPAESACPEGPSASPQTVSAERKCIPVNGMRSPASDDKNDQKWSRGELNPRAVTVRWSPLRVYLMI